MVGKFYNCIILFAVTVALIIYFSLIVKQAEAVIRIESIYVGVGCFLLLIVLNVVGNAHFLG